MLNIYTYGATCKRGIILTAKLADIHNRFARSFEDAQKMFFSDHGRDWTPNDPIFIPFGGEGQLQSPGDERLYNEKFVPVATCQYWIRNHIMRRPIREQDVETGYLIKKF